MALYPYSLVDVCALFDCSCVNILNKMVPKRKYDDSYIKFGFIETRPQCVKYSNVLSNDALKATKLERHLKTVHPKLSDRPPAFFTGKLENLKKMKLGTSDPRFELNEKVLSASFKIAQLIAKS